MAIESTGLPSALTSNTGEATQGTAAAKKPVQPSGEQPTPEARSKTVIRGDSVTLTKDAMNLSMIQADIKRQPEVDTERVNSLKAAIESGNYEFNPGRVAEKFLQFESQL